MLSDDIDDSSGSARVFIVSFYTEIGVVMNSIFSIGPCDGTNNRVGRAHVRKVHPDRGKRVY